MKERCSSWGICRRGGCNGFPVRLPALVSRRGRRVPGCFVGAKLVRGGVKGEGLLRTIDGEALNGGEAGLTIPLFWSGEVA